MNTNQTEAKEALTKILGPNIPDNVVRTRVIACVHVCFTKETNRLSERSKYALYTINTQFNTCTGQPALRVEGEVRPHAPRRHGPRALSK